MFRWMVSRPAVFCAGLTAGVLGTHHFSASVKGSDTRQVVAKATGQTVQKKAVVPMKFEPLPEADDQADWLQIPRIAGVAGVERAAVASVPLGDARISTVKSDTQAELDKERVATVKIPAVKISEARKASAAVRSNPIVLRELARNIQTELVRVGCQSVTISGRWDSRTVRATAKYLSNRNALLPSDRPDIVLLSMLRGYQGSDCGLVERRRVVASRAPLGAASQPVTIRSASLPGTTHATGTYTGAAQAVTMDEAIAWQPVGRPAVQSKSRAKSQGSNRPRQASRKSRKKQLSWRHKIHYGNGLDD